MGLSNRQCDLCECVQTVLFPLAIVDKLPSGVECMIVKYYCRNCFEEIVDAIEDFNDEQEKEEEEEEDDESHSSNTSI